MGLPAIAGQIAAPIIGSVASAIPGSMESMYRKDIKADRARLAGGRGGLTAGQRGMLQSEALNSIQAQQAATTANLARGSADGSGDSGMRTQNLAAVQQAGLNAGNAAMSDVRNQDLQLAEAQRQQLYARMAQARAWGQQRKQESLGYMQKAADATAGIKPGAAAGSRVEDTSALTSSPWGK